MRKKNTHSTMLFMMGILCATAQADVIDVSLNNDVAQFYYQPDGSVDIDTDDAGARFGFLFNDDGDWMLSGKLVVPSANSAGLQLSPGIKASAINLDDTDSINLAISIGGRASGLLPTTIPLRAYGELYYAPSITAFNDLEDVLEVDTGIEYQASNNASVYLGYRRINVDIDNNRDIKLDNKFHAGIKLNF